LRVNKRGFVFQKKRHEGKRATLFLTGKSMRGCVKGEGLFSGGTGKMRREGTRLWSEEQSFKYNPAAERAKKRVHSLQKEIR